MTGPNFIAILCLTKDIRFVSYNLYKHEPHICSEGRHKASTGLTGDLDWWEGYALVGHSLKCSRDLWIWPYHTRRLTRKWCITIGRRRSGTSPLTTVVRVKIWIVGWMCCHISDRFSLVCILWDALHYYVLTKQRGRAFYEIIIVRFKQWMNFVSNWGNSP